jgi:hypothetical protein
MTDPDRPTDALDRLTAEIRDQRLDDAAVAAATGRVWARLEAEHRAHAPLRSCADVQRLLPAYAAGKLDEARALLVGDHTRNCVPCRRALLELKAGASTRVTQPDSRSVRRAPAWLKAAAAVLLLAGGSAVVYDTVADRLAEARLTAAVASADGSLQLVDDNATTVLADGATVGARQRLRTGKDTGAMLRLADGSTVEMAPRSELSLGASRSGTTIALARGNVIVHAADQGRDRLRGHRGLPGGGQGHHLRRQPRPQGLAGVGDRGRGRGPLRRHREPARTRRPGHHRPPPARGGGRRRDRLEPSTPTSTSPCCASSPGSTTTSPRPWTSRCPAPRPGSSTWRPPTPWSTSPSPTSPTASRRPARSSRAAWRTARACASGGRRDGRPWGRHRDRGQPRPSPAARRRHRRRGRGRRARRRRQGTARR